MCQFICHVTPCVAFIIHLVAWQAIRGAPRAWPKTKMPKEAPLLRTAIMVVRLTEAERQRFERDAEARGLQLSSWARMMLLDKVKRERESV